eukprot:7702438-Lingulodinium_polyedra.AAC.1
MRAKPAERGKTRHDKQARALPQIRVCTWQHSMLNQLHPRTRTIETVSDNAHAPAREFQRAQDRTRLCAWR